MRLQLQQLLVISDRGLRLQPPPAPIELKEWAWNTLLASVIGMGYCGSSQALRNKRLGACCGRSEERPAGFES